MSLAGKATEALRENEKTYRRAYAFVPTHHYGRDYIGLLYVGQTEGHRTTLSEAQRLAEGAGATLAIVECRKDTLTQR